MTQHTTPETWEVWSSLYEGFEAAVVHNVEPLETVAEVRKFANARLIASAPDLLRQRDALLEALKVIDAELSVSGIDADAICDHAVGICWCSYNAARDAVRAAIARAQSPTQPETEVGHE